LQRGGAPTPFDRWLATGFGTVAVELIEKKSFGRMMSFHNYRCRDVALDKAVGKLRRVTLNSPELKTALSVGTTFGNSRLIK